MTQERKLKLFVRRVDHKCTDSSGEWDGTWDETYEYVIYDDITGDEVTEWGGYPTREKAREAGEEKLKELKEIKFNSQICTSREQSERLLALGLKKETADCYWKDEAYFDDYEDWNAYVGSPKHSKHIPAWSLHRLIELCRLGRSGATLELVSLDQTYDKYIGQIRSMIKEGYFNKDYLQEQADSSREG